MKCEIKDKYQAFKLYDKDEKKLFQFGLLDIIMMKKEYSYESESELYSYEKELMRLNRTTELKF